MYYNFQYDIELRIRNYLNNNGIILIDKPYYKCDESNESLLNLSQKIGTEFIIESSEILGVLLNLQKKAEINIENIDKFRKENVYTLKIHFSRTKTTENLVVDDINLTNGEQLKFKIAESFKLSIDNISLIFKGKIIDDSISITDLGIKNNSKILVLEIKVESDMNNLKNDKVAIRKLDKSKNMASYLSERAKDNRYKLKHMDIDITNQSGEVLELTKEEKALLTYGLSMHERATHFITKNQFQEALLHCLEADQAFKKSQYSDKVDNTAILQLDIVWCYYKLQNMDDLIDANDRLCACERRMRTCYGEDNERIQKIRCKTTFEGVPEMVHVFRLYLLFGVLKYYQNDSSAAVHSLEKARKLYNELSVPTSLLESVMLIGFDRKESLEALRITRDVNAAVEYIYKRREQINKETNEAKKRKQRLAIAERYGSTSSGARLNLDLLEEVIRQSPGVDPALCLISVLHNDNDPLVSSDAVFSNPDVLKRKLAERKSKGEMCTVDLTYNGLVKEKKDVKEIQDIVQCSKEAARQLLRQCDCDKERALSVIYDENYCNAYKHLFNSEYNDDSEISSNAESDATDADDPFKPNAELEEEIMRSIANQDAESKYNSNELWNEIEVFNKFADLLRISTLETV